MSTAPQSQLASSRSHGAKLLNLAGWGATVAVFILCLILAWFYAFVGDTIPLGEAITTVPPIVWLAPLSLLCLPVLFTRSLYAFAWSFGGVFLLLLCDDWQSLVLRHPSSQSKAGIRVITWNIAGRTDWENTLQELEKWQPDIIFFQETPDGDASLSTGTLNGYWKNFSWWDQGDCGILCRFEMTPVTSASIGPWDKPALAVTEIPVQGGKNTVSVLLCSVRLMMSANVTSPGQVPTHAQFKMRVQQYDELAKLLSRKQIESNAQSIILAGDFNVRGRSFSLNDLKSTGLRDVWEYSGTGWGGTILADLPVARIDQVWVLSEWKPLWSRTAVGAVSDHRLVICEMTRR